MGGRGVCVVWETRRRDVSSAFSGVYERGSGSWVVGRPISMPSSRIAVGPSVGRDIVMVLWRWR